VINLGLSAFYTYLLGTDRGSHMVENHNGKSVIEKYMFVNKLSNMKEFE